MKVVKIITFIFGPIVILGFFLLLSWAGSLGVKYPQEIVVSVGGEEILVQVADTLYERVQGLSGRQSLPKNEGMLFVFKEPGFHKFWMKDMNFVIDIVWVGDDFKVVGFTENVSPETFPKTFGPPGPVQYVLETNTGWAEKRGIKAGDKVSF